MSPALKSEALSMPRTPISVKNPLILLPSSHFEKSTLKPTPGEDLSIGLRNWFRVEIMVLQTFRYILRSPLELTDAETPFLPSLIKYNRHSFKIVIIRSDIQGMG